MNTSEESSGYIIQDESAHRFFTQIPNIIIDNRELSHTAFRLYIWYKKVCGESGQCYQSIKTISEGCSMRRQSVIKSRRELEAQGLIRVEKSNNKNGSIQITVIILDIWKRNNKVYEVVRMGYAVPKRGVRMGYVGGVRMGYCNKNPLENKKGSLSTPKGVDQTCDSSFSPNERIRKKRQPTKFHHRCAREFAKVVSSHIKINCRANMIEWANQFRKMEENDKVPKSTIRDTIKWYSRNIGGDYIPQAYSAKAFRQKYMDGKFTGAMEREKNGNGEITKTHTSDSPPISETDRIKVARKVKRLMIEQDCWLDETDWPQEELDEWLTENGFEVGVVTTDFLYDLDRT